MHNNHWEKKKGTQNEHLYLFLIIAKNENSHIRDRVHEGNVDFDGLSDQVLDFSKHWEVILGFDIFRVGGVEACNETS